MTNRLSKLVGMSIDQLELVGRSVVHRGRFKLSPDKNGRRIAFPAGTIVLWATGPHPKDVRYGDTASILLIEHPDIDPSTDLGEYPLLDPKTELTNEALVILAWKKDASPDPQCR